MEIFVNIAMTLVAGALIGYPFFTNKGLKPTKVKTKVDSKEVIFSALGELEFDYRMNKLSAEDYQELKSDYQQRALKLLEAEDEALIQGGGEVHEEKR